MGGLKEARRTQMRDVELRGKELLSDACILSDVRLQR